ncbi:bifunctional folylpolyglutamate synthase/dihydrofolate synthase [Spiroplasma culicicola]|uniref:Folylpolyglutamate synthase n=1 Tax=Spiroplasma culicicola AES-1 TaxID=1276246 RepID=W6A5Z6_9MOLU|nr:Mur ligase family protein [Spiroplasma culicicola]AHI52417.1 folylpolyglutamate synthase [Spiroplasma culicicola AES-1]
MISVNEIIIDTNLLFKRQYNLKKLLVDQGNPQNNFQVINIVGTNGKGSTSNYIYKNLNKKYQNYGLFISPAFLYHNERVQVNGKWIDDETLLKIIEDNKELFLKYELTFFEIWTYIAIIYFNLKKIEIAVIEAGIGGVKDSTNLFENQILVGLTSIGYDHTEILGESIDSIIENKVKIVKKDNPLFTIEKNLKYKKIIEQYCKNKIIYCSSVATETGYQKYNKGLAKAILNYLEIDFDLNTEAPLGRKTILRTNPSLIIDGCHNLDGVEELINSIENISEYKILFATSNHKNYQEMIDYIKQYNDQIYICEFDHFKTWSIENVKYENKVNDWKQWLTENKDSKILVCGSLYFIPLVYHWLQGE